MTLSKRFLLALAVLSLGLGVASWIIEGITPSWIVFPIFLVLGLVRARKGGSSGIVWFGVSAFVFLLVHIPFDKAALSKHCVNPTGSDKACHRFFWLTSLGAVPLLVVVTAVVAFREARWRLASPSAAATRLKSKGRGEGGDAVGRHGEPARGADLFAAVIGGAIEYTIEGLYALAQDT